MKKGMSVLLALLTGAFMVFSVSCKDGDSGSETRPGEQGDTGKASGLSGVSPSETTPSSEGSSAQSGEDPVWIKVNGEPVHKSEVKMMQSLLGMQFPTGRIPEDQVKRIAMINAAQMELLNQAAAEEDIEADPEEVQKQLDAIKQRLPEGQGLDPVLQEMGLSKAQFRDLTRSQLVHSEVLDRKTEVEEPTEKEIKQEYEEQKTRFKEPPRVKVKQIMLSVSPTAGEEEKKEKKDLAESIRKKIKEGADFMKLAKEHSDFGGTEEDVVRTIKKGVMPEKFDQVVFNMEKEDLSPVIETDMGYHIVKVLEKKEESASSLKDVRDKIVEVLKQKKKQEAINAYMEGLMDAADIEYVEPLPEQQQQPSAPGMQPPDSQKQQPRQQRRQPRQRPAPPTP
ncbi:MAG: peptidylprolyl isomerase [bacterium]